MSAINKPVIHYLRLIRWPNIVIIILTQVLIRYAVIGVIYTHSGIDLALNNLLFSLLVLTTVIIASAGYIINDYFDMRTDRINKPISLVVGRYVGRRSAIKFHMVLNGLAILMGFYISWQVGSFRLGLIFPMITLLLWLYSERYKRMVLVGNLAVAFLSALVILIVWLFEFFALRLEPDQISLVYTDLWLISQIVGAYAVFAFLLSMVREIVKDVQDISGDSQTGCRTLPVVYGISMAQWIAVSLLGLTLLLVLLGSFKLLNMSHLIAALYFALFVGLPVLYTLYRLALSKSKGDFKQTSNLLKLNMLAGIIGMIPLAIYL